MALPTKTRVGHAKITWFESTINLASISTNALDVSNDIQVPGAKVGDPVVLNWNNESAVLGIGAYVSADGVVTVVANNSTSGSVDAASSTFSGCVIHRP